MKNLQLTEDELVYLYAAFKSLHRNEIESELDEFISVYNSLITKVCDLIDDSLLNLLYEYITNNNRILIKSQISEKIPY